MKRTALVTGGGRGIGFGIAERLAREGFDLALSGRSDASKVAKAVETLEGLGAHVLYCAGDVAAAEDRARLLAAVRERFGRLDALVNNAGVGAKVRGDLLDVTQENFEWILRINLLGPFALSQEAARWMIEQKGVDPSFDGCIINIGSISATVVSISRGDYCVSKAALAMMTKLFAARLGEHGIPVYEIRPGIIETDMTAGVKKKYDRLIADTDLLVDKRWGRPADIGRLAAAMARGDFPYATGQAVTVDGGLTMRRL